MSVRAPLALSLLAVLLAASALVAALVSDGDSAGSQGSTGVPSFGSLSLERDDRGNPVVAFHDAASGDVRPVLQITEEPAGSVDGRAGIPHFRSKVFFHGFPLEQDATGFDEFLEFRTGNLYPDFEHPGSGVGGFATAIADRDLLMWAEGDRAMSFSTNSRSPKDVGQLGTRRLTIGAGPSFREVPVTLRDAYLEVAGGPRLERGGLLLPQGSYLRLHAFPGDPPAGDCDQPEEAGRLALSGASLVACDGGRWRRVP
ncbi:MAG TPA: hypothetical protein VNT32_07470 [Thermoleophilaceae bacterium]|nr:hypothetical protein [Thermoleophilaceae bacterium]